MLCEYHLFLHVLLFKIHNKYLLQFIFNRSIATLSGKTRLLPPRTGVHVWDKLEAEAAAARAAEIASGCYDTDAGISFGCSQYKDYCNGGWLTTGEGVKYIIGDECSKTCGTCAAKLARQQEIASGCYDSNIGYAWPCSSFAAYCSGGSLTSTSSTGVRTSYKVSEQCRRTCRICTSG